MHCSSRGRRKPWTVRSGTGCPPKATDGSTPGKDQAAKQPGSEVDRDGAADGNVSVGATRYADWASSDSEEIEHSWKPSSADGDRDEEQDSASEDRDDERSSQECSDQSEESDGDDSDSSE
ncbi:hypothetical protein DFH06DRAFT_1141659 [Mycena polygramma]|nr:hypothetical protein DFH06DRAFT_1141659 [Mycena polygramma]